MDANFHIISDVKLTVNDLTKYLKTSYFSVCANQIDGVDICSMFVQVQTPFLIAMRARLRIQKKSNPNEAIRSPLLPVVMRRPASSSWDAMPDLAYTSGQHDKKDHEQQQQQQQQQQLGLDEKPEDIMYMVMESQSDTPPDPDLLQIDSDEDVDLDRDALPAHKRRKVKAEPPDYDMITGPEDDEDVDSQAVSELRDQLNKAAKGTAPVTRSEAKRPLLGFRTI